jgi:outer membrane protein assembly factor BamB
MRKLGGGDRPTRRDVLRDILVGSAAGASTLIPQGQEAMAQAQNGIAELDPWPYGRNSFATDTVLMFRGNPAHTFYGTGPLPETAPRVLWRHRTPAIPQTLRGITYVWTGTGWTGTAAKLGDYVYVGSLGAYLYCFEAMTGRLVWSYRAGGLYKSSVCLYDNKVYVGNTDDYLHCVDARNGHRVWASNTGSDLDSSPCVVDGVLYTAGENGHARAIDPQTGREI